MKRMIPSSKLTVKNDKLTALEGIYDAEGNQIIADGGSLVAGNPEVPSGTSPTELSGLSVQNDSTKQYFKITHSPVVEANPVVPSGAIEQDLLHLKVGSSYYKTNAFDFQETIVDISSWEDGDEWTEAQMTEVAYKLFNGYMIREGGTDYYLPSSVQFNASNIAEERPAYLYIIIQMAYDVSTEIVLYRAWKVQYDSQENKYLATYEEI